jgi:uncharacterized membrane protein SpoIIM required for sporulation
MRESNFIGQNKEKWRDLEKTVEDGVREPEKLYDLFVGLMDDLAYARTHYPNRPVQHYLNDLATHLHVRIYKTKYQPLRAIQEFWLTDLPLAVFAARKDFLFATLVFLLAIGTGILSTAIEPDFIRIILGDAYVDMTLENIAKGDPLAVYKDSDRLGMFVGITTNNLLIAVKTFVYGILFALGTIVILLQNGIMIGTFHYFFAQQGLLTETLLTVWIHGSLEISAIVIAGAAGITMGKGWIFPGTLSRGQSFRASARKGLKIMVGTIPVFVLAGLFEAYLTRYTETPDWVRASFIGICLVFVTTYFVWLPRRRGKSLPPDAISAQPLRTTLPRPDINRATIKTAGQLFQEVFIFFQQHQKPLLKINVGVALTYCLLLFFGSSGSPSDTLRFPRELFGVFNSLEQFFRPAEFPEFPFFLLVLLAFLNTYLSFVLLPVEKKIAPEQQVRLWVARSVKGLFGAAGLLLIILTRAWYTKLLLVFLFPALIMWFYTMIATPCTPLRAIGKTILLLQQGFGRVMSLSLSVILMGMLLLLFTEATLMQFVLDWLTWIIDAPPNRYAEITIVLRTFIAIFILSFTFMILFIGMALSYFSLKEVAGADNLKAAIAKLGQHRQIRGLEKE